ncbi:MAG: hypothetical protein ACRD2L_16240, partial [Terriglobia bacterium]
KLKLAEVEADFAAIVVKDLEARLKLAEDALREAAAPPDVNKSTAQERINYAITMRGWYDGPRAKALEA